ncbi:MAG: hypothetical protein IPN96_07760 [Anaerolineales bacterium]|mgnify:CR=1 FL=1|uniref:hypothetical protein n=1 Tax=Candidatus Villigracilis proximus TaxID=3140683 RepID=UPI0031361722|nr:hypothetical protein [Anaerolineales bacterium]MBK8823310.1 hypothetical protein [Anaerolineales bacterium]MBK9209008.1 hypothetical protein [Anaerolineales bacterium]
MNEAAPEPKRFPEPTSKITNSIWIIVISSFAAVMVFAALGLIVSMFLPPAAGGTSGQLILTVFTTVVGFMAGLFTPSPVEK